VRRLRLAWLIAELLGASIPVGLVIVVAGGIAGLVLISLVFRLAMWVLGRLAGATIAIKVYAQVGLGQGSALVAVLLAAAVGLIVGFLADRHRAALLAAVTALGGASVMLNALAALATTGFAFLGEPTTRVQGVLVSGVWLILALAGWLVQRRALQSRAERVS
jgi:hypothetical protein